MNKDLKFLEAGVQTCSDKNRSKDIFFKYIAVKKDAKIMRKNANTLISCP